MQTKMPPNPGEDYLHPVGTLPKEGDYIVFGSQPNCARIIGIERGFMYWSQEGGYFHKSHFERGVARVVNSAKVGWEDHQVGNPLTRQDGCAVSDVAVARQDPIKTVKISEEDYERLKKVEKRYLDHREIAMRYRTFFDPLLAEAMHKVHGDRQDDYGDKFASFKRIADLQGAAHQTHDRTRETVAVDNLCQKLARLMTAPDHYDTLVDIVGFVLCYRDNRKTINPEHYLAEEGRFQSLVELE